MSEYELIVTIVNTGFAEQVMDFAKSAGCTGGTILHARGTGKEEAEKFFGIAISPEKEIVISIVKKDLKDAIIKAIYNGTGLKSPGQGISFSLPVDDVVGLSRLLKPEE